MASSCLAAQARKGPPRNNTSEANFKATGGCSRPLHARFKKAGQCASSHSFRRSTKPGYSRYATVRST
eukprot:scaffold93882_cov18-Tisochrysis_lutea.AAC.1